MSPLKPRTSWEAHWEKTWSHSSLGEEGWQDWFLGVWANLPLRLNPRIHGPRLVTLFPEQLSLFCSSHQRAFLVAQRVKNLLAMHKTRGLIHGSGRSPGEGNGYPLQYSCLQNPMDRGAWWAADQGVATVRYDWVTNTLTSPPVATHWREHYSGKSMGFGATD